MADLRRQSQINNLHDLNDLLTLLKNSIMSNTHVSSLARFSGVHQAYDETLKFQIIKVVPFPIEDGEQEHTDYAYCFSNRVFTEGEYVLIVYTDKDFRDNIQLTNWRTLSDSNKPHKTSYGVVIPIT